MGAAQRPGERSDLGVIEEWTGLFEYPPKLYRNVWNGHHKREIEMRYRTANETLDVRLADWETKLVA